MKTQSFPRPYAAAPRSLRPSRRALAPLAVLLAACVAVRQEPGTTELGAVRTVLPLRVDEDGVFVRATIEGEEVELLVDTGASVSMIRADVAERLGLESVPAVARIDGISGAPRLRHLRRARAREVRLGTARFHDVDLLVLPAGADQGILGVGFFADLLLTLRFPSGEMVLERGSLDPSAPDVLPYAVRGGIPVVTAVLGDEPRDFELDTGNASLITLDPARTSRDAFLAPTVPVVSRGINRDSTWEAGRLRASLRVGEHEVLQPIAALGADDNIGMHVLRHFDLTLDQAARLVRLTRADRSPIDIPPMMGYAFTLDESGRVVERVLPDSGAERGGLRVGDRVVAVSGSVVPGRPSPMTLEVRREGLPHTLVIEVPWEAVIR